MGTRGFLVQNPPPLAFQPKKLGLRGQTCFPAFTANPPQTIPRLISIIIPAHNEERYLGRTLEALHRQTYSLFEIIVIANGCDDRTAEIARGRCHRLIVLS